VRRVLEPLITLAKEDGVARRRLAFSRLRDRPAVGKLFNDLGPRFKARPGGYLRILKMGYRAGDAAPMALVMLTDKAGPGAEAAVPAAKKTNKKAAPKAAASKNPRAKKAATG